MTELEQFMETFDQYWNTRTEKWRIKALAAYGRVVRARNKAERDADKALRSTAYAGE